MKTPRAQYESPQHMGNNIATYYKISESTVTDSTSQNTVPDEFPPPKIFHRKFKNSRIPSYFKCKSD